MDPNPTPMETTGEHAAATAKRKRDGRLTEEEEEAKGEMKQPIAKQQKIRAGARATMASTRKTTALLEELFWDGCRGGGGGGNGASAGDATMTSTDHKKDAAEDADSKTPERLPVATWPLDPLIAPHVQTTRLEVANVLLVSVLAALVTEYVYPVEYVPLCGPPPATKPGGIRPPTVASSAILTKICRNFYLRLNRLCHAPTFAMDIILLRYDKEYPNRRYGFDITAQIRDSRGNGHGISHFAFCPYCAAESVEYWWEVKHTRNCLARTEEPRLPGAWVPGNPITEDPLTGLLDGYLRMPTENELVGALEGNASQVTYVREFTYHTLN